MGKFRIVFQETRCHYYDIIAKDKDDAINKAEAVYYNDEENKDVKLIEKNRAEANDLIDCYEIKEREKFARKCDQCEKVFNEGYCIGQGEQYFCSKECLNKEYTDEEFDILFDNGNGDSYWTSWEDEDEYQYYEDGSEVEQ